MTAIAALQLGAETTGTNATLEKALSYQSELRGAGVDVVVMPEGLLGGYPKGSDFGARLGYRVAAGRAAYREYWERAIDVPGPETKALCELAKASGSTLVVGVIERQGYSLFCTALFFSPDLGLVARHRKLMPTGTERLVWSQGDGSTMPAVESKAGLLGAAICWENYMPLFRSEMYSKGISVWCAPTVDERDIWQVTMRHIAYEARCFVVSACQVLPSPAELNLTIDGWSSERPLIRGGSVVVSPMGEIIAGPLWEKEGLVTVEVNLNDIVEARYDLDVCGHYARPDIFSLTVNRTAKQNVIAAEDVTPSRLSPAVANPNAIGDEPATVENCR